MGNTIEVYHNIRYLTGRVEVLERENQARKQEVIELRSTLKLLEQSLIPSTSQPVPPDEVMEEPEPTNADDESKVKLASLLKAQDEQKKRRKPRPTSNLMLNVKSWSETVNIAEVEELVRSIEMNGLVWGTSKVMPLAYGVQLLQIGCTVEDELVKIEELLERIQAFEQCVEKVEIAALNKRYFSD